MIHAYDEKYLDDAMDNLGEMTDYIANACDMDLDTYWKLFLSTEIADGFGKGIPRYVCGLSGTELAMATIEKAGLFMNFPKPRTLFFPKAEYWCGWALAYYQWYTGKSFRTIYEVLSMQSLLELYPTCHEASEEKVVEVLDCRMRLMAYATRLQVLRRESGLSQRELSEKSGVNIRMIQQYEIKAKDINKAAGKTLIAMARVLGCQMEELLEA